MKSKFKTYRGILILSVFIASLFLFGFVLNIPRAIAASCSRNELCGPIIVNGVSCDGINRCVNGQYQGCKPIDPDCGSSSGSSSGGSSGGPSNCDPSTCNNKVCGQISYCGAWCSACPSGKICYRDPAEYPDPKNFKCKNPCEDKDPDFENFPPPGAPRFTNPLKKGTITDITEKTSTDTCSDDGKKLTEYFCGSNSYVAWPLEEDGYARSFQYDCPFGCKDGACKNQECKNDKDCPKKDNIPQRCNLKTQQCESCPSEYVCRISPDGYNTIETYSGTYSGGVCKTPVKPNKTKKCNLDCETCAPVGTQDSIRAQACSPVLDGKDLVFYSNTPFTCRPLPDGSFCENPAIEACSLKKLSDKNICGLPSPVKLSSSETISVCRAGKCKREEISDNDQNKSESIAEQSPPASLAEKIGNFFASGLSAVEKFLSNFIASLLQRIKFLFSIAQFSANDVKAADDERALCYADLNVYGGESDFSNLQAIIILPNIYLIDPDGKVLGRAYGDKPSKLYIKTIIDDIGREIADEWSEDGKNWKKIRIIRNSISPETSGLNPQDAPVFQENIDVIKNLYIHGYSDSELKIYLERLSAARMGYSSAITRQEGLVTITLPDGSRGVYYEFIKDGVNLDLKKMDCLKALGASDLEKQKAIKPKDMAIRLKLAGIYKKCLDFDSALVEFESILSSKASDKQKAEANSELTSIYLAVAKRMASNRDNMYLMAALRSSCAASKLNPMYQQGKNAMQKALLNTILRAYIGKTDESAAKLLELTEILNLLSSGWVRIFPGGHSSFNDLIENLNKERKVDNDIIKAIAILKLMIDNDIDLEEYINADISKQQDMIADLIEPGVEPPSNDEMEAWFVQTAEQGSNPYCETKYNPRARWKEITFNQAMLAEYRLIYLQDHDKVKYKVYYDAKKLRESVNRIVLLSDVVNVLSCGDTVQAKKLRKNYSHLDVGRSMQECGADPQLFQKKDSSENSTDPYKTYFKFQTNESPYQNDDKFTGSLTESTIMFFEEATATFGLAIGPRLTGLAGIKLVSGGKNLINAGIRLRFKKELMSRGFFSALEGQIVRLKNFTNVVFDGALGFKTITSNVEKQIIFKSDADILIFVSDIRKSGATTLTIIEKDSKFFLQISFDNGIKEISELVTENSIRDYKGFYYVLRSEVAEALDKVAACSIMPDFKTFPSAFFRSQDEWRSFLKRLWKVDRDGVGLLIETYFKNINDDALKVLTRASKAVDREIAIVWYKNGKIYYSIGVRGTGSCPLPAVGMGGVARFWHSHTSMFEVDSLIPSGQFVNGDDIRCAIDYGVKSFEISTYNPRTGMYQNIVYKTPTNALYQNFLKKPIAREINVGSYIFNYNESLMKYLLGNTSLICKLFWITP